MSGLLRRIKRSRPADAGEPHPEGRAAETEGAATTAETPPAAGADASEATTQIERPAGKQAAPATDEEAAPATGAETAAAPATGEEATPATGAAAAAPATGEVAASATPPRRPRWRPFRRRAREIPAAAALPVPVLHADPNVPAGIDPAQAPMRPPAGRRGRLRRRLRYLRRARELMLRDLGGLLYEIHRTGGGNVDAHATVVGAKVQRIAGLDAEAHALEAALAAPRAENVVFEPGVGGTCATCGELYGSDARFCANCGTPIGAAAEVKAPETGREVVAEPARRAFWRRAARPAEPAASDEAASVDEQAATGDAPAEGAREDTAVDAGDDAAADPRDEGPAEAAREDAAPAPDDAATQPRDEGPAEAAREDAAPAPDDVATQPRDEGPAEAAREDAAPAPDDAATQPHDKAPADAADDAPTAPRDERAAKDSATDASGGSEPHDPQSSASNGRPEERRTPGLPSGDPLFSRERS